MALFDKKAAPVSDVLQLRQQGLTDDIIIEELSQRGYQQQQISEAIAQMWVDGGLKVKIEKTAYSARRPTLVARSIDVPWAWNQNGQDSHKDTNAVGPHVPRAGS